MMGGSFLSQWARYRKLEMLEHPQMVVGVVPEHRPHFDFVLEIAAHISLISKLSDPLVPQEPLTILLSQHLKKHSLEVIITPQYVSKIWGLHAQWHKNQDLTNKNKLRQFLIHILAASSHTSKGQIREESMSYPRLLGSILKTAGETDRKETFEKIVNWWSFRNWAAGMDKSIKILCLLWIKSIQIKGVSSSQDEQSSNILKNWFSETCFLLSQCKQLNDQIVGSVTTQLKQVLQISGLKNKKQMKPIFHNLKKQLFALAAKQPEIFALLFGVLEAAGQTVEIVLFECHDLLQHESLYSCLYYLQRQNKIHFFISFQKYMRQFSVMSVLILNRSLSNAMNSPIPKISNISQAIQAKNIKLIAYFNLKPISLAKAILTHYLKQSGIFITEKRFGKVNRVTRNLKLNNPDPLQFMLIRKQFWQDKFGYEMLGLALWIITEGYCKEVQHKCSKDHTDKAVAEYIKKLKISLCLFLLSFKYPVKMLQLMPYQSDISSQFPLVPVLPSLLLETHYFFSQFDRQQLVFRPKRDFGNQGQIFPWASSLTTVKNIRFVLHNYKGYQFYGEILDTLSQTNFKQYSQVIVATLTSALTSMGISSSTTQDELHRLLGQISVDIRRDMCVLLGKAALAGDRTGALAEQFRGLILDSIQ